MLMMYDQPAKSQFFFHLFFTYNKNFYYLSTFNAWIFFMSSMLSQAQKIFLILWIIIFIFIFIWLTLVLEYSRAGWQLQFHASVWSRRRSSSSRSTSGLNTSTPRSLVGREFSASPSALHFIAQLGCLNAPKWRLR